MTTIVVNGKAEFLPAELESQYGTAFTAACEGMNETLAFINDPDFHNRVGWKLDCKNDHIDVFMKDIGPNRFFVAKVDIPLSSKAGLEMNWGGMTNMTEWNDNIKFSKCLGTINDHMDIANYASNKKFMVDSREFVAGRMKVSLANGSEIVIAKSAKVASHVPDPSSVQAYLHLGAGIYYPSKTNPNESTYEYILSMDLKGMLLKTVVNQVMGKLVLSDVENNRLNAIKTAASK